MAMHIPMPPGFAQMMKDGAKHYAGLDEAVYRNTEACKEIAKTTRSTYGPNGQNKMVINHLEKLFVTNDAATILRELEVQHPAAKMIVLASQQQEQECGDGTNFVLIFAGSLLAEAEELLRMGLSVTEVVEGFETAMAKVGGILETLVCGEVKDFSSKKEIETLIRSSVMSKQFGLEDFLANLISDACLSILPTHQQSFNVDNVRISKIPGQGVLSTKVMQGMVFKRAVEGEIIRAKNCKVAVYSCPLDIIQTETKGTVLIKTAKELKDFSGGEEAQVEQHIKEIAESGCSVVVAGGKVGELALHFANKYKLMVVRLLSKFDLRRLCKSIGATPLPRVTKPTAEEIGFCDEVYVDEVGDTSVVIFKQGKDSSPIATVVIRGATENIMDDVERAIDDGVNTLKALTKDARYLPGGGATEIELAHRLASVADKTPGMDQYGIRAFSTALEDLPRALADNSGVKSNEIISSLYAEHQKGNVNSGFYISGEESVVANVFDKHIFDLFVSKYWAIQFATQAACTVLKVDQIIMAKRAGGPKPKEKAGWDDEE